ncbi:MAG: hypothetical protein M3464_11050 [Chloroflexota bacterium]|nr:hypothetical protein [Chloroflexota bacterium]
MPRISLGLVFLGFGALKFMPDLSPVEDLVADTMRALTLGLIPDRAGLLLVATVETVIGLLFLTGRYPCLGLALLGLAMVGILAPLVLFPNRLFSTVARDPRDHDWGTKLAAPASRWHRPAHRLGLVSDQVGP